MDGHADTSTAGLVRTIFAGSVDFAIVVDLVEFENSKFNTLVNSLNLLWLCVSLLLSLLSTTTKTEDKMKGRFLLDVVIRKCSTIFKLLSSKDQTLLIRRN